MRKPPQYLGDVPKLAQLERNESATVYRQVEPSHNRVAVSNTYLQQQDSAMYKLACALYDVSPIVLIPQSKLFVHKLWCRHQSSPLVLYRLDHEFRPQHT